jgi:ATP-dependent helicase HepA
MNSFKIGQRWRSSSEPELGLGIVKEVQERSVIVDFVAVETSRHYECEDAPLERARLSPGQSFQWPSGETSTVDKVITNGDTLSYLCGDKTVAEQDLPAFIDLGGPMHRLLHRQLDAPHWFDIRHEAILAKHHSQSSPLRGLQGGRILLYPHQLDLAHRLCQRRSIRVMLADEVGLGKTIEAALIAHRLLLTGRVERILIVVPPTLTHQWFIEFYLRFNLSFRLVNEDTLLTIEDHEQGILAQPLVICSTEQLLLADWSSEPWDLVIADEVHHLNENDANCQILKTIVAQAEHVLLLSATPPNLDDEEHFKRLRWLDPDRYSSFDDYGKELKELQQYAELQQILDSDQPLNKTQLKKISKILKDPAILDSNPENDPSYRQQWSNRLVDMHGPGYHLVKNTRQAVGGFPQRHAHVITLEGDPQRCYKEFEYEQGIDLSFHYAHLEEDPRIIWLGEHLKNLPEHEKCLVLCNNRHKTEALVRALEKVCHIKVARFHEELSLMEKDRQAAWFNETGGPTILVSSSIGAEGRNFQRANHLVLMDCPLHPAGLEQSIGRLDRIGQYRDIHIYIPTLKHSPQEKLCLWYHHSFDAFQKTWCGVDSIHTMFKEELIAICLDKKGSIDTLIAKTQPKVLELLDELHQGRDILLERCAWNPERAEALAQSVDAEDNDQSLEHLMLNLWDRSGIDASPIKNRSYRLRANMLHIMPFPGFKEQGMSVSFDRAEALDRDDITFLSWDHPMVRDGLDQICSRKMGKASVAVLLTAQENILMEALFVLHHRCPQRLAADRYLPPTPLRLAIDRQGRSLKLKSSKIKDQLLPLQSWDVGDEELQSWLETQTKILFQLAEELSKNSLQNALASVESDKRMTCQRLQDLAQLNPSISPKDILAVQKDYDDIIQGIQDPVLELDALRIIICRERQS